MQENPRITAIEIAKTLKNQDIASVHPETVRHLLRSNGIHNRVPRKKPFISKINMEKRVEFAKKYIDAYEDFWANVLFSDESKFNLFGYDGKQKVWRRNNEALLPKNLLPTVKHGGGSIMVWGCMSAAGVGNLTFIDINMDRMVYLDILKDNLKQSASKLGLTAGWYFQQDNDPKHTAGVVKEWLLYNVPHQLHSPPQSPDLNPIENLWDELDRRIRKRTIKNKQDLKNALLEEWNLISNNYTKVLVNSMQNRLNAVLESRGGPTKY